MVLAYKPGRGSLVLVCLCAVLGLTNAVTIMSIDIGSEWMKVAVVAAGVPMEIALNKESKRKTPVAVSFRNDERTFGADAIQAGTKSPHTNFVYILDLLGKSIDNPMVELYKKRFPYYNIESEPERGTISFRLDEDTKYTVEELMAQFLTYAKDMASAHTDQRIKDAVITVPPFFNQAERRSLLTAAKLAGLKVLTLMNSNAAVALNHGMFRRKEVNDTAQYMLFYDMGASSSTATIVSYQTIKTKEKGYSETNPEVKILGVGYDRTLGGAEMQLRLRDYLATKFNDMKKTKNDVFQSARGMAKIMKEASRLKHVLSANVDHTSQIEGVLDDQDFRLLVSRTEFEGLCEDLFERVRGPVDAALISAGMDIKDLHQFIIVGGNTRVPRIQSILKDIWGEELGKNINADEAAAMGAIYRAADLGEGFKVKKFHVKDAVIFPIEVDFDRQVEGDDGKMLTKSVKRALFSAGNGYPQKKVMTFNKHTTDFNFSVNYGDLSHLSLAERKVMPVTNISLIEVTGVTDVFEKQLAEGAEAKGIKAHFNMDDSGVLTLGQIEAVFEKSVMVEDIKIDAESVLSKLGSSFNKLFSGSEDSEKEGDEGKDNETEEQKEDKKTDEENDEKETSKKKDGKEDKKDENKKDEDKKEKEVKPKIVTVKEDLNFTVTYLDIKELDDEQFKVSKKKLEDIDQIENERMEKEVARNDLESYILNAQDKLYQEEYEVASNEDQRTAIRELCSTFDEWLYEEGFDEVPAVYKEKLSSLKELFEPIAERVEEHRQRPEAIQALNDMINGSSAFLHKAMEAPTEERLFTDADVKSMDKLIIDTQKWLEEKENAQADVPLNEPPKLTLHSIGEKMGALDREIKYLVNKAKIAKAKRDREVAEAKIKAEKEAKEAEKLRKKANKTIEKENEADAEKSEAEAEKSDAENGKDPQQENEEPASEAEENVVEQSQENDTEQDRRKLEDTDDSNSEHIEL